MLQPGDQAPLTLSLLDENGQSVSLEKMLGRYVVLYFYPKDDTPGCTVEACSFRDVNQDLQKKGVTVIGVSKDSLRSHAKFTEKYTLNFPLWSDPDHLLLEAFGAWGKKTRFGRAYMGVLRSTFIINPQGKIIKTWEKVKPEGHAQEVLAFLEQYFENNPQK